MARRQVHLIGLLGMPNAGKTAAIVSMYLLLANAKLKSFSFADSDTLMAFEELARGARKWNEGTMPEQMTGHTELNDVRSAGYLHLRLKARTAERRRYDLLLPDLPGEWTTQLINQDAHSRFSFLSRADAFWIVYDGNALTNISTRNHAIHRIGVLIKRLRQFVGAASPRICLVLTRRDRRDPAPVESVAKVVDAAAQLHLRLTVFEAASFSSNTNVPPGTGLNELLEHSLLADVERAQPDAIVLSGARQFLRYRN